MVSRCQAGSAGFAGFAHDQDTDGLRAEGAVPLAASMMHRDGAGASAPGHRDGLARGGRSAARPGAGQPGAGQPVGRSAGADPGAAAAGTADPAGSYTRTRRRRRHGCADRGGRRRRRSRLWRVWPGRWRPAGCRSADHARTARPSGSSSNHRHRLRWLRHHRLRWLRRRRWSHRHRPPVSSLRSTPWEPAPLSPVPVPSGTLPMRSGCHLPRRCR